MGANIINFKAMENNPEGLKQQSNELIDWLKKIGFRSKECSKSD